MVTPVARAIGCLSLFAMIYYATVFLSHQTEKGALLGCAALAVGALLSLVPWRALASRPAWFQDGWPAGWLLAAVAVALGAVRFVAVDAHAHSASDALVAAIPMWSLIAGAATAVARAVGAPKTGA